MLLILLWQNTFGRLSKMANKMYLTVILLTSIAMFKTYAGGDPEWNHDNPNYIKNGNIQLKDSSGYTWNQDRSNDYRSLNSTSSPTVLNNIITSEPTPTICFKDSSTKGVVYYENFELFEIPTRCEKKYSISQTLYYNRSYEGQSPYFTFNFPGDQPIEHEIDAAFNGGAAKLNMGYESATPFLLDVFFRITSVDGEVLFEESERVPNNGNTPVNITTQIMRYNRPEDISNGQFATWDIYLNFSVDGTNTLNSRFDFLILKTPNKTFGNVVVGDVGTYYRLN